MHRRVNPHRLLVSTLTRDALIHVKQVAIALLDHLLTELIDRFAEVQINTPPTRSNPATLITALLRRTRRNITRRQIPETRILPLKEIITIRLWDLRSQLTTILSLLRHPHPPVIAQRLRHQRQLALIVATHRNARRVNLRVTRIRKRRPAPVRTPRRRHIAPHRIRRQKEHIPVAARAQQHRVRRMSLHLPRHQITRNDPLRLPICHNQIKHLRPRVHFHSATRNLLRQRGIRPQQQLLPRLTTSIKRSRNLRPTKGPIRQSTTILPRKRNPLGHTLVDDIHTHLRKPMHIRLPRSEIPTLHRVIKQPMHRVPVVLIVLRRIDPTLRRNRVRTPRAVLKAKTLHFVAQLRKGRRCRSTRQTTAHHNDGILALVLRIDQFRVLLVAGPLFSHRTGGNLGVELHGSKFNKGGSDQASHSLRSQRP